MSPALIAALSSAGVALIGAITALVAQVRHVNGPAHQAGRLPPRR